MYILSIFQQSPLLAVIYLVSIVAAVTVHEFSHAWTADRLGDDTPYLQGRLSLNPASHLDLLGSLAFVIFRFGWGKPVMYNPMKLGRKIDELLIALAGPVSNLLFALALNLVAHFVAPYAPMFSQLLGTASYINVILATFNLLPVPPLDGSAIVAYFWPGYRSVIGSQLGLIILLVIIFTPLGSLLYSSVLTPILNAFTFLTTLGGFL